MGKDKRGVLRGKCTECDECKEFETTNSDAMLCEYCGHRPTQHERVEPAGEGIQEPPQKKAKGQDNLGKPLNVKIMKVNLRNLR